MKLKKRIGALVMAAILCVTMSMPVMAEEVSEPKEGGVVTLSKDGTVQNYDSVAEAVAAVGSDETATITFNQDFTGPGVIVGKGGIVQNITFNLQGHTWEITNPTVGSAGTETNGMQLLKGNTVYIKDGTIKSDAAILLIQNYCDLTLDNVKASGKDNHTQLIVSNNNGKTVIKGDSQITAAKGGKAFDSDKWGGYDGGDVYLEEGTIIGDVNATNGGKITISGGTVDGNVISNNYTYQGYEKNSPVINISGGTITGDVKAENIGIVNITNGKVQGAVTNSGTGSVIVKESTVGSVDENVTVINSTVGDKENVTMTPDSVAAIADGQPYGTLNEAVAAGGNVTLMKDVKEDIVIPAGKEVTLDLNGHTLTNNAAHTITNNGTLTVTDNSQEKSGIIDSILHGKAALYNSPTGKATILAGTFTRSQEAGSSATNNGGNSFYTIQNQGIMVIGSETGDNSGIRVEANGRYSSLVANGYQDGNKKNPDAATPTLTINGGTYSGGINTIKNDETGELVINDGIFNNYAQHSLQNWNVATVNGGSFTANDTPVLYNGVWGNYAVGDLKINGGSFEAGTKEIFLVDGYSKAAQISGGEYSNEIPEDYIVEGKTSVSITKKDDTKYYVGTAEEVAKIVKDKVESGDKVTVQKGDITLSDIVSNVTVENKGEGTVTVNGTVVDKDSSITTQEPKPEEPSVEEPKPETISKADVEKGVMDLNKKIKATWKGSKAVITWGKVSKADGYEVYAAKCGSKMKLVKDVKGADKVSLTVSKINGKKLNKKSSYKTMVKAYRIINGKKTYVGSSYTVHTVGKNNKTYTNAKSVKVTKKTVSLKNGKTKKISAKLTKQSSKKKILKTKHVAKFRYYSTNTKVAKVTKSGTIKATGKGKCTVYVMAANGVKATVKVTVK